MPSPLTSLYSAQNVGLTYNELISCCKGVTISLNKSYEIEKATREQSHCGAWYAMLSDQEESRLLKQNQQAASPSVNQIDRILYLAVFKKATS